MKAAVLAGSLSLLAGSAFGQGLSDPVGYYTKTFQGGSDTSLGLGLLRPEFGSVTITTVAAGVAGINETLTAGELDAPSATSGSIDMEWDTGGAGAATNTTAYMLLVTSGANLGAYYGIVSNGANDLTLDLFGDTVTTELDGASGKIVPFWDLDALFPSGAGFNASTQVPFNGSRLFFNDITSAGINLPRAINYVYLDGTAIGNPAFTGFYRGDLSPTPGTTKNALILPDEHVLMRHAIGSSDTSLTVTGDVLVDSLRIGLVNQGNPAGQDIAVGVPYPVDLTPNSLGLASIPQSAAFLNSTNVPFDGDRVFLYNDAGAGQNKPYAENYIFLDFGTVGVDDAASDGWYDGAVAPNPANRVGDSTVITANRGILIRKPSGSVSGDWVFTSPYTP